MTPILSKIFITTGVSSMVLFVSGRTTDLALIDFVVRDLPWWASIVGLLGGYLLFVMGRWLERSQDCN